MSTKKYLPTATVLTLVIATLTACGGGSADSVIVLGPPTLSNIAAQGIWHSATGAATDVSAVVTDSGQVWSLHTAAGTTRLVKAALSSSASGFTGTGKSFVLGSTAVDTVTVNATALAKTSMSGNITSPTQSEVLDLAYQTRYDTPVTLSNFAGTWSATLGPGTVTWTIDSAGVITGTRTTGCTYTGQLSLRPEAKAVANAVITESCPAVTQLSGVAIKTTDNKGITMLLTTAGDAQGAVLILR